MKEAKWGRRVGGVVTATCLAAVMIVRSGGWSPLCVLYEPGDWMYIFLDCGNGGPPKDPTT